MTQQRIIGINTHFEALKYNGFDEYKLSDSISLLDYDAAVINSDELSHHYYSDESYENKMLLTNRYSKQIQDDFSIIRDQLIEMLEQGKNIFILVGHNENCFIYTGEKKFSGTGRNTVITNSVSEFDMYSFLPVKVEATHIYGDQVEICCKNPYADFFKKAKDSFQYSAFIAINESDSLLKIKGSSKTVSAVIKYGKGRIIFLPSPYMEYERDDEYEKYSYIYLDALFELNKRLSFNENEYVLPDWTNGFSILNEKEELDCLEKNKQKLDKLSCLIEKQQKAIKNIQRYKTMLTTSGSQLEGIVKDVLFELGFTLIESEPGRSDIIAKYNNIDVVAEIKGVTKSAAEKHAAQLEKWVAQFIEENNRQPKPLLIVNGFCDTPILDRDEDVFPAQMLKYSMARNHILVDTTQLLCLYIETKNNPSVRQDRITELLSTIGIYKKYKDLREFILFKQ